jgi:hypothetical protein
MARGCHRAAARCATLDKTQCANTATPWSTAVICASDALCARCALSIFALSRGLRYSPHSRATKLIDHEPWVSGNSADSVVSREPLCPFFATFYPPKSRPSGCAKIPPPGRHFPGSLGVIGQNIGVFYSFCCLPKPTKRKY